MIYTICTIEKIKDDDLKSIDFGDIRTVGYFLDFESAEEAVKNNYADIWETIYDYALIEEVSDGLYPFCEKRWLYQFDKGEYRRIEEPKVMHHFSNFSIG